MLGEEVDIPLEDDEKQEKLKIIEKEFIKKGFTKDVIISILTAKGTPDHDKMRGLEAFIYDYIIKPFDIDQLTKLIANQHLLLSRNIQNA